MTSASLPVLNAHVVIDLKLLIVVNIVNLIFGMHGQDLHLKRLHLRGLNCACLQSELPNRPWTVVRHLVDLVDLHLVDLLHVPSPPEWL